MSIKVLDIHAAKQGNLKAFADVQVGSVIVFGFRIIQQDGQKAYVQVPQADYIKNGVKRYAPVLKFKENVKDLIQETVLKSYEVFMVEEGLGQ